MNSTSIISLFETIKPPTGRSDILLTVPNWLKSILIDSFDLKLKSLPNDKILYDWPATYSYLTLSLIELSSIIELCWFQCKDHGESRLILELLLTENVT